MIPAYKEGWTAYGSDNETYIKQTTLAADTESVVKRLRDYAKRNTCDDDVTTLLANLICSGELLHKVHVVYDGSYRNCCILIRPDGAVHTGYVSPPDYNMDLQWYMDNAETLFINLCDITWHETNEWFDSIIGEYMEV